MKRGGGSKSSTASKLSKKKNAKNRQAKLQGASSARFVEVLASDGAPVSAFKGGLASYRVSNSATPDLNDGTPFEDAEFTRCLRLLNKRDAITREKALVSLKEFFESETVEELKPLTVIWANRFSRIIMDNSRSVRQALHEAMKHFIQKLGKFISPALSVMAGPWLCSLYDPVSSVASVSFASFVAAFPDREKQKSAREYLLPHFLEYADSMFNMTPKKLAEPWDSKEESDERYQRIICSCIGVITSYDYNSIANAAPAVLRALRSKNPSIRRAAYEFVCRHCSSWDSPGPSLSLMTDHDLATRRYMWPALVAISSKFPEEWSANHVNRFIEILHSSSVDQYAYGACLSIVQSWHSASIVATKSVDFQKRLSDAIWSGSAVFSKAPSAVNEAALLSAFSSCLDYVYDNFEESYVRSEFLRYCVWDRIVTSFKKLQGTSSDRSQPFRFQEAGILPSTFSTLGRHLSSRYAASWIESSLAELSCTLLSSDDVIMTEVGRLLLAADWPTVNSAVFAKALQLNHLATITLCSSLISHFPVTDFIRQSIRQALQLALSRNAVPSKLIELYCHVSGDDQSEVFQAISQSENSQLLFDFVELCRHSNSQLWGSISSACLQRFKEQPLAESNAEAFSSCFKTLLKEFPDASANCREHLAEEVISFSRIIENHSVLKMLSEDFAAFESKCIRVRIALCALRDAKSQAMGFYEALFFISCLLVFTPETSESSAVESGFMQNVSDLAHSILSKMTTDRAEVYLNVCSKLYKQLLSCSASNFDYIVWAAFASHIPSEFIMNCFPDSAAFLTISDPKAGQLICDACMEVMDIVAADFAFPGTFQISLLLLESHLSLDQRRAGRMILGKIANNGFSVQDLGAMLDIALEALRTVDEFQLREAVQKFSLSVGSTFPELIIERFISKPMLSKMVLISALAAIKDDSARQIMEQCLSDWIENCLRGKDVNLFARCIATALSAGFEAPRDTVWQIINSIPQSDSFLISRFHLMGAAIEAFPINEASTEIVDGISWIKDVLEEWDPARIDVALQLLNSIIIRCGSKPFHIQEAIDMCLPLLSPSSLQQLKCSPRSVILLRDLISHIDFKTIPRESNIVLIKNLLHQMISPPSEMSALAYSLISRALISGAQSVEIGDSDPHCDDSVAKAELLVPQCILEIMLFDPLSANASPILMRRYLLTWLSFIDAFAAISAERRDILTSYLRYSAPEGVSLFFQDLMEHILGSPPVSPELILESNAPQNMARIPPYLRRLKVSPHSCRLFGALAGYVYYRALSTFPVLARLWYSSCERSAAEAYKKITAKRFTPLLIENEISSLRSTEVTDSFSVKCSKSGEIIAVLRHSEVAVRLLIRLAAEHPLRTAEIDLSGTKGVDAKRIKWWTVNINMMMSSRNGSVQDAIFLWKRNVESHFEGVEECPICYSILHAVTDQIPRLACRVCKNKFHSACLYKWFSSSSGSSCPLCRSAF